MTDDAPLIVDPWPSTTLDREVVMARVLDAPVATAFRAWTDPAQIVQWFGPAGFAIRSHEIDIRPGGLWRFEMVAPDGTVFANLMRFVRIEDGRLIEFVHGASEDDPDAFRMLVTFDAQHNGKTVLTLRQLHPSAARRAAVIGFGAVEYGAQTWDKLAAFVAARAGKQ